MTLDLWGKTAALTCAFLWAVAVIFFKRSGESIRPVALNLYKTWVTALLFVPVFFIAGEPLWPDHLDAGEVGIVLVSGILGITVADSLFFKSLNILGAGLSGIVDCMYSPSVICLSFLVLGEKLGLRDLAGACMVISGVFVATFRTKYADIEPKMIFFGVFLGASGMFVMAFSIVIMKPILDVTSVLWVTEARLVAAALLLVVCVSLQRDRRTLFRSVFTKKAFQYALPGTLLGNFLAMTLWIAAFKWTRVNLAAILNQTSTIFIVVLASLVLREPFTVRRLAATLLAVAGSILVLFD